MKSVATFLAFVFLGLSSAAAPLDLSGEWRFALDPEDSGIRKQAADWKFPDTIRLPGMVNAQGLGEVPSIRTKWTGDGWRYPKMFKEWQADDNFKFPFFLQPPHHYAGPAWFQREVEIPDDWQGRELKLTLERVKWLSTLWIDGEKAGGGDSLGTPHVFRVGPLKPGTRTITLRLDIDDWFTNRKLGYVFEAQVGEGRLIACAFDIEADLDTRPAARQLRASLLERAAAGDFEPGVSIEPQALRALLREP